MSHWKVAETGSRVLLPCAAGLNLGSDDHERKAACIYSINLVPSGKHRSKTSDQYPLELEQ